ncbi:PRC-barrel domain-containing protein [Tunicatimonas pelagia]|uniref:PRC-barrel domain-containing protein n=1 Tax=Tunicatimonas pelagia TaxID=931531 RepID=UPI0026657CEB|nr:PRC-barrel domain-containing protein [Tunicatimonas pelagia]WKN45235.1 PRC-barrel domain-containing protein [Tunicatimonas pelagia]
MMISKYLSANNNVIGCPVHNSVEEKVGIIQDVFISPETNQIVFAILEEGGFLGLVSDEYAVPWSMLEFNTNSSSILLEVRKEKIKNAPKVDIQKLINGDRAEISKLEEYYGTRDLSPKGDVDQEDYQAEQNTDHPHQGYEGSAKITGEVDSAPPAEGMDYEKVKGINQNS